MTLFQFNIAEETEQADAIWGGTYLGKRQEGGYHVLLYRVDGFYVEAYYDRENEFLHRFKSFADTGKLISYEDKSGAFEKME